MCLTHHWSLLFFSYLLLIYQKKLCAHPYKTLSFCVHVRVCCLQLMQLPQHSQHGIWSYHQLQVQELKNMLIHRLFGCMQTCVFPHRHGINYGRRIFFLQPGDTHLQMGQNTCIWINYGFKIYFIQWIHTNSLRVYSDKSPVGLLV